MSENLKPTCVLVENAGGLLCRHCGKAWTPHDEVYFGYTKNGAPNRVCAAKEAPVDLSKVWLVDVDEFNKMLADYKRVKAELNEVKSVSNAWRVLCKRLAAKVEDVLPDAHEIPEVYTEAQESLKQSPAYEVE